MLKTKQKTESNALEENIMFVTTIYDTFEALEETLGKLKLETPLFLTYIAKKAFAEEVFKYARLSDDIYLDPSHKKEHLENRVLQ
ncbi:MAG: hypothetical protein IJS26_04190 [Alphaproteobacteria bacterium]|nr:hypothetical protein [Alphaproteobacteria bacterium]